MNDKCSLTTRLQSWMSCIVKKGFPCHFCGITQSIGPTLLGRTTWLPRHQRDERIAQMAFIYAAELDGIGKDALTTPKRENHLLISKHIRTLVEKPQAPKCKTEDKQHGWIEWNGICRGCWLDPEEPTIFILLDDSSRVDLYEAYQRSSKIPRKLEANLLRLRLVLQNGCAWLKTVVIKTEKVTSSLKLLLLIPGLLTNLQYKLCDVKKLAKLHTFNISVTPTGMLAHYQ